MRELSMEPSPLPKSWADLFLNRQTAEAFVDTTEELRGFIKQIGANYKIAPNKLGIEVKKARPRIHLLYFSAIRRAPFAERSISAPYLSARIFIKKDNLEYVNRFRNRADLLSDECVNISGRTVDEVSTWDKNLIFSYEYVASLENFVTDDIGRMKRNILRFGRRIYEHVVNVVE